MSRFTIPLLFAVAVLSTAPAPAATVPSVTRNNVAQCALKTIPAPARCEARLASRGTIRTAVAGPSADDKVIPVAPEGESTIMQKWGDCYVWTYFTGLQYMSLDGNVSDVVFTADKDVYMNHAVCYSFYAGDNYIKGHLDGDIVSFTFPQLLGEHEDYDGAVIQDYALKMEYIVDDPDSEEGWYYPCDEQTFRFRLNADGTLTSLEEEQIMIGNCNWMESEEHPGVFGWSWQGAGDFIDEINFITDTEVEVPDDVEFETWNMIDGISARSAEVAFAGDKVYMRGFTGREGLEDRTVVGTLADGKVSFPNDQYLGIYDQCTTYFITTESADPEAVNAGLAAPEKKPALVVDYDSEKHILSSADGAFFLTIADRQSWMFFCDQPYLSLSGGEVNVTSLTDPIITDFFAAEDDFPAELYFDFPVVDPQKQVLDKSKLFYQLILDGEVFTFYNDEYELPEGVEEMTDVPYDYSSEEELDFFADDFGGVSHGLIVYPQGYETLGIRTLYKDGDNIVYSNIIYVPGFGSVKDAFAGAEKSVEYFDLAGRRVLNPAQGIYIRRAVMDNGVVKTSKVVIR